MRANSGKPAILFLVLLLLVTANTVFAESTRDDNVFAPAVVNETTSCTVIVNEGQSIQAAVDSARSAAVICVRNGTYVGQVLIKPAQAGVTLMAYPGEQPIIDGRGTFPVITTRNKFPGLVQITGSNVVVDGFDVRNSNARDISVAQPATATPLQNVIVRNNIVQNSKGAGIIINGGAKADPRNVLIENNTVYNNLLNNAGGGKGGSALTFVEVQNSTARGNRVYHNYGEGIVSGRYTNGIVLEGNMTYDNQGANLYLVNTQNPIVDGNYIFCTDDPIGWRGTGSARRAGPGLQVRDESFPGQSTTPAASSGQIIINNIVVGCGSNFGVSSQITGGGLNNAVVANNTFVNASGVSATGVNNVELDGKASYRNTRFANNIILQTIPGTATRIQTTKATPNLSTFSLSNNLYNQTPSGGWPASEPGRVIGQPQLANVVTPLRSLIPTPDSFALTAGSPAIDGGTGVAQVTDDFFGQARSGAPDIGADEFGGGNEFPIPGPAGATATGQTTDGLAPDAPAVGP